MISWPAAKQMRWVKPSITTVSPSCTCAAMASCIDSTLEALSVIGYRLSAKLDQTLVEDRQGGIDVVVVHDERRRQTQRALAGAEQEEPLGEGQPLELADEVGVGRARGAIDHEFDADHET